jgi:hypothetical protein
MAFYSHAIANAVPVQVPQFFIYHTDGSRIVVKHEEYLEKINSGEWFATPLEAENALEKKMAQGTPVQMILTGKKEKKV